MRVSLCLIVKDEIDYLEGCIESARSLVDDIVVVDTGSSDGTDSLAARLGATVSHVPFEGDFSAARNAALALATGDWIIFLDADERLVQGYRGALERCLRESPDDVWALRLLRYNFFATGGFYTGRELRVLRNRPGVEYRRKVNESVAQSISDLGGRVASVPVVFNHFGHCRPVAVRDAKAVRYLGLMGDQLRERPDDAVLIGYQGLILRTLGRFEEALRHGAEAVRVDPESVTAWFFQGHILRSTGRDEEALRAYRHGLDLAEGGNAGLHNMVGVQLLALGDRAGAAEHFREARLQDPQLLHTDINLGLLAEAEGDWKAAETCFAAAADANPGFLQDTWSGRHERDPYRAFYYETPLGYQGLAYHLAHARYRREQARTGTFAGTSW